MARYLHGGRRPAGPHNPPGPPPRTPASLTPRKEHPMNNTLTVTIPREAWLTSNRPVLRTGHRSRIVRMIHARTTADAELQRLTARDTPVHAVWTIHYPKGTGWAHGDAANAHPTCKGILDALVEGGWLPGDGPRHVVAETYRRGPNLYVPMLHDVTLTLEPAPPIPDGHTFVPVDASADA